MTKEDIESVIQNMPYLNYGGNGFLRDFRQPWETYAARLREEQEHLLNCSPMLSLICVWCSAVIRRKSPDSMHGSYRYKHDVEDNFARYVSNGQFIAAAVFCGITCKEQEGSINVDFGISRRNPYTDDTGRLKITGGLPGDPNEWWGTICGTTGESLWRNVIASPGDRLARGVLADWLDEAGESRWAFWLRAINPTAEKAS